MPDGLDVLQYQATAFVGTMIVMESVYWRERKA
jgi:hypothetical protein